MSNKIRVLTNLSASQNVIVSGSSIISGSKLLATTSSFNKANIVTASGGMYDLDVAIHALDTGLTTLKYNIKSAYDSIRAVLTGALDNNGNKKINLTTAATSGSVYFTTESLTSVGASVLIDTDTNDVYKNDLVSLQLFNSASYLWAEIDAPEAANDYYRLMLVNHKLLPITSTNTTQQLGIYSDIVLDIPFFVNNWNYVVNTNLLLSGKNLYNQTGVDTYNSTFPTAEGKYEGIDLTPSNSSKTVYFSSTGDVYLDNTFTIMFDIYINTDSIYLPILTEKNAPYGQLGLIWDGSLNGYRLQTKAYYDAGGGYGVETKTFNTLIQPNQWVRIMMFYDAGYSYAAINGTLDTADFGNAKKYLSNISYIGGHPNIGTCGSILRKIVAWNRVLGAAEVSQIQNNNGNLE